LILFYINKILYINIIIIFYNIKWCVNSNVKLSVPNKTPKYNGLTIYIFLITERNHSSQTYVYMTGYVYIGTNCKHKNKLT